jgi:hypothetical protein
MQLTVQYLRDASDPGSRCWALVPFTEDLEQVMELARAGFKDVNTYFGANHFCILDEAGRVLASEAFDEALAQRA